MPQSIINVFSVIMSYHSICLYRQTKHWWVMFRPGFIKITYFLHTFASLSARKLHSELGEGKFEQEYVANDLAWTSICDIWYISKIFCDCRRITQLAFADRKKYTASNNARSSPSLHLFISNLNELKECLYQITLGRDGIRGRVILMYWRS